MSEYQQLYRMYGKDGRLLYVGISKSALARFAQHAAEKSWIVDVVRLDIETVYCSREEILEREKEAIIEEQPQHNKIHTSALSEGPKQPSGCEYDWTLEWALSHPQLVELWTAVTKAAIAWVLKMEEVACDEYGDCDREVSRNALMFLPYLISKLDMCDGCRDFNTTEKWVSAMHAPFRARGGVHQYWCPSCNQQWIVGYGEDYKKQPAALMSKQWLDDRVTFRNTQKVKNTWRASSLRFASE
jgi:predicted GIY-YIG superfamily endonuclease